MRGAQAIRDRYGSAAIPAAREPRDSAFAMQPTDGNMQRLAGERDRLLKQLAAIQREDAHLQVPSPTWDTKTRCSCGAEFASRCEFWKHQADAYVELVSQRNGGMVTP
jgi:hypothetical protein